MDDNGGKIFCTVRALPGLNLRSPKKKSEPSAVKHHRQGEPMGDLPAKSPGTLYMVATPIGNLEDITLRALRILKEVALIAAEDTRHTRKLLTHYGIGTPLISYYREKEAERGREIVDHLAGGRNVALVSDAGTPGISDPGALLVELARAQNIPVVPVPGPSALTAMMSVAGRDFSPFLFLGFLPSRANQRRKLLASLAAEPHALVFFESPRRTGAAIQDCLELLGNRQAIMARELTKLHEEIRQESLAHLLERLTGRETVKGELILAIEGAPRESMVAGRDLRELLIWYRQETDISLRDAVKRVAADLGMSRSEAYQEALEIWKKG
jgi:16S rRNA (cytidine1402-2'-O)-methyltransferase